jgi:HK97 family phage prohead protease
MEGRIKFLIGSRDFERRKLREARDAGTPFCHILRRDFQAAVRSVADDSRALDFVISTAAIDRYGDTVAPEGWKLANFRKNPVVLWMHDNTKLPVAKATNVRIENGTLKARAVFTPPGQVWFNDTVLRLLKDGFLSAASVGFIPTKYKFIDDPARPFGIDFLEQDLLEFSIVTVPANPDALIEGRAAVHNENSVAAAKARLDALRR